MQMRAMGPGSVSSLLKSALDVVYFALWAGLVVLLLAAPAALIVPFSSDVSVGGSASLRLTGPVAAAGLASAAAYTALLVFVSLQLRRIFATLTAGDPFHPANVARLRAIGAGLAGLEIAALLVRAGARWLIPDAPRSGGLPDLAGWFSVLVVFVLAEVFREGARLRRDAELTI